MNRLLLVAPAFAGAQGRWSTTQHWYADWLNWIPSFDGMMETRQIKSEIPTSSLADSGEHLVIFLAFIGEVITHMAFYGGWPTAANAVRVAKEVFDAS